MENNNVVQSATEKLFDSIIEGLKNGTLTPKVQAKCVCVDAQYATADMVGQEHIVWSHGKIEKIITIAQDTVLLTTLDKDGNPVIDEKGNKNIYDMPAKKFEKKYPRQINGHYAQDGTPMITVELPQGEIPAEGIELLPPNWGGYTGTLMQGGLVMFPYDASHSLDQNIKMLEDRGCNQVDWYPNNEANTYSPCDENGVFLDERLQKLFKQTKTRQPSEE